MPSGQFVRSTPIVRTARVAQLEGMFDVPPSERSEQRWAVTLPLEERDWSIGLIVGPSGSGKSTIARELFGKDVLEPFKWAKNRSIIDGFPLNLSIKDVAESLSSVGFSSPPAWLRPFHVLSTGEQFRVTIARALAQSKGLIVVDEFTSVVDRTVAQIGSAAIAKAVRRRQGQQFIAVTCHYDVEDWLQPEWVYQPHLQRFQWRQLQRRPPIDLVVSRCHVDAWAHFRGHHYLSADVNRSAKCFVATWAGRPVAFVAVLPNMGHKGMYREHRAVCLPDFQGASIGSTVSDTVASIVVAALGVKYRTTTSHPAFIASRRRSPNWRMRAAPSLGSVHKTLGGSGTLGRLRKRLTSSFEYVGPPWADAAQAGAIWNESFCHQKRALKVVARA